MGCSSAFLTLSHNLDLLIFLLILISLLILNSLLTSRPIRDRLLMQSIRRIAPNQPDKQRHDVLEQRLPFVQFSLGEKPRNEEEVQATGTFQARAAGNVKKLAATG